MNTINHNQSYTNTSNLTRDFTGFNIESNYSKMSSGMKNKIKTSFSLKALGYYAAVTGFALAAFFAQVANATPVDDYRAERERCLSGQSQQDTQTCLQEAGAALQEKRANNLDTNGRAYLDNSIVRCENFMGEEKIACQGRSLGFGRTSGSVEGGGRITTIETVVVPPGETVTIEPQTPNTLIIVPQ